VNKLLARTKENKATIATPQTSSSVPVADYSGILFQGWASLAFWMVVGLLLESLMAYKTPVYLQDTVRRELFRLGHAHGTVLGLVLIAAALSGERFKLQPARAAQMALRIGAILMPLGFLLAGIWHYESDPGLGIWLVPAGALLLIFGVISFALAAWSNHPHSA
jgi:hypothetical protein